MSMTSRFPVLSLRLCQWVESFLEDHVSYLLARTISRAVLRASRCAICFHSLAYIMQSISDNRTKKGNITDPFCIKKCHFTTVILTIVFLIHYSRIHKCLTTLRHGFVHTNSGA